METDVSRLGVQGVRLLQEMRGKRERWRERDGEWEIEREGNGGTDREGQRGKNGERLGEG